MTTKLAKKDKTESLALVPCTLGEKIDPNNITEYGIRIVMDEEKILREQEYDLEDIYNGIDHLAQFAGMKKIDKYYYVSINDTPSELGCFVIANLEEREWFMDNVKEVIWYDKVEGITDMLKFFEEKNRKKRNNEKIS